MSDTYRPLLHICETRSARWPGGNNPFQIIARLAEESGELASAVNHQERTGVKTEQHGDPDSSRIAAEAIDVILTALHLVRHYELADEFEPRIEATFRSYGGVADSQA